MTTAPDSHVSSRSTIDAYGFLGTSGKVARTPLCPRDACCVVLLTAPVLIFLATLFDGTVSIPSGKGFSQHYGFWVIFISSPLLVLMTSKLLHQFSEMLSTDEAHLADDAPPALVDEYRSIAQKELDSLRLESKLKYVLFFGILVSFLYLLYNAIKTYYPQPTYGHDVFDGWSHRWGYVMTKLYLTPVFLAVYPCAVFITWHITLSMARLLRFAREANILKVNFFAEDNCGGMSKFGLINLKILFVYLLLFSVLGGMVFTHQKTYFVTRSALLFCSSALVLQTIAGVLAIQRAVAGKKKSCLQQMALELDRRLAGGLRGGGDLPADLLALRDHVMSIYTFPYSQSIRYIVGAVNLVPTVLAIISYFDLALP